MAQILDFIHSPNSYDPETLRILSAAYDLAVAGLRNSEQLESAHKVIAGSIMDAAMKGERDPKRLCEIARRRVSRHQAIVLV